MKQSDWPEAEDPSLLTTPFVKLTNVHMLCMY